MKKKYLFPVLVILSFTKIVSAQPNWQQITTVEEVCLAYPERMKNMLQSFNFDLVGLEKVKRAYEDDNILEACNHLLEYYKNSSSPQYLRMDQPSVSQITTTLADSFIQDIYTYQLVEGKIPRLPSGNLDWSYKGPENDLEYAWGINRHHIVGTLLRIYFETGNPKYAQYIDLFIKFPVL